MPVVLDKASIHAKVLASKSVRQEAEQIIKVCIETGVRPAYVKGEILSKAEMIDAAEKLKSIMMQNAMGLPDSVRSHVANASIGSIVESGPGQYTIELSFSGDMFRPSLVPEIYGGVDNIVALFNNGYRARSVVFGEWHGDQIASKQERVGTHFLNTAIDVFNSTCGGRYHAKAELSGEYR